MSDTPSLAEMLTALGWRVCSMAEHRAGFRVWDVAANESAVARFDDAYHLRGRPGSYRTIKEAVIAAYRERFPSEPVAARSSPRRPLDHADLTHDWTPYYENTRFVFADCPDCLTRVNGLPPSSLCPDRVKHALATRDATIAAYRDAFVAAGCKGIEDNPRHCIEHIRDVETWQMLRLMADRLTEYARLAGFDLAADLSDALDPELAEMCARPRPDGLTHDLSRTVVERLVEEVAAREADAADKEIEASDATIAALSSERDGLRGRVGELERALRPFAAFADTYSGHATDTQIVSEWGTPDAPVRITVGHLRAARSALTTPEPTEAPDGTR